MQTIVEEVVGKEDQMMSLLTGKINLATLGRRPSSFDNDDDEWGIENMIWSLVNYLSFLLIKLCQWGFTNSLTNNMFIMEGLTL